jgi:hypothetical protein
MNIKTLRGFLAARIAVGTVGQTAVTMIVAVSTEGRTAVIRAKHNRSKSHNVLF